MTAEYPKDIPLTVYAINDAYLHFHMSNTTRIHESFAQTRRGGTGGVHVTLKLDPSIQAVTSYFDELAWKAFCQAYNRLKPEDRQPGPRRVLTAPCCRG
jgi:uncharacterized membrane protein